MMDAFRRKPTAAPVRPDRATGEQAATSDNSVETSRPPVIPAASGRTAASYLPDTGRRPLDLAGRIAERDGEGSKLIVGRDIELKGEIKSCDTLVVEGRVEASMQSRRIQVAESGVFKGEAGVEVADVHGRFEGALTARDRLIVRATGRISGTLRYSRIEIEPGGEIAGEVQVLQKEGKGTGNLSRPAVPEQPREAAIAKASTLAAGAASPSPN